MPRNSSSRSPRSELHNTFPWPWFCLTLVTTFILENRMDAPLNWIDQSLSGVSEVAQSGDIVRKILVSAMGLIGAIFLTRWHRHRFRLNGVISFLLAAYIAWSALSVIWADDPELTVRRLIGFLMLTIFELACVARMNEKMLSLYIAGVPTLILIPGLLAELNCRTFQPLTQGYRFTGTAPHPNVEAAGLSLGVMILCWQSWQANGRKRLYLASITIITFGFLWLTGSRTSILAFLIAGVFSVALMISRRYSKRLPFLLALSAIVVGSSGILLLGVVTSQSKSGAELLTALNKDRDGDLASGNGRVELWQECMRFAAERPFLGYGYAGFWSERHIQAISDDQQWVIEQSHSAYIDQLLALGLPGAILYPLLLIVSFAMCVDRFFRGNNTYGSWAAVLLVIIIVNFSESINMGPLFPSFTFELIVLSLAYTKPSLENSRKRFVLNHSKATLIPLPMQQGVSL